MRFLRHGLLILSFLVTTVPALAQSGYVRLAIDEKKGTIAADGEYVEILSDNVGGFGTIKAFLLDSYSGTIEVQCSSKDVAGEYPYDADSELTIRRTDTATTITSLTDTVGVYDILNAAGCRRVRVVATAGFASTDVQVVLRATQTGGAGGASSGGGGGGGGDMDIATFQTTFGTNALFTGTIADNLALTQDALVTYSAMGMYDGTNIDMVRGNATDGLLVNLGSNNDVTVTGTVTANAGTNLNTSALLTTVAHDAVFGTAGTADTQVMSIQGIASMTPVIVSATNLDVQIGGSDTLQVQSNSANLATQTSMAAAAASLATLDDIVSGAGVNITQFGSAAIPMLTTQADDIALTQDGLFVSAAMYCYDGTNLDLCRTSTGGAGAVDASTGRFTLATDDANTGPWTKERYITAGSADNENEFKSGAGRFGGMIARNSGTTNAFIKCYDNTAAGGTPGSTTITWDMMVPANADAQGGFTHNTPTGGVTFGTGFTCYVVTGAGDSDTTDVAANEVSYTVYYK